MAWWDQGPLGLGEDAPDPRAPGATSAYQPPDKVLTTLGWLKHVESPVFPWFEWHYLKFLHKCLTDYWWLIQGGSDDRAMELWHKVFVVLELDRKARVDIMLLAQSGLVGRSVANELMWDLMSTWALVDCYEDLSHKVSYEIKWRRRTFDRPREAMGTSCGGGGAPTIYLAMTDGTLVQFLVYTGSSQQALEVDPCLLLRVGGLSDDPHRGDRAMILI